MPYHMNLLLQYGKIHLCCWYSTYKTLYFSLICFVFVCVCMCGQTCMVHTCRCTHADIRGLFGWANLYPLSIMWVMEIILKLSGLVTSALPAEPSHQLNIIRKMNSNSLFSLVERLEENFLWIWTSLYHLDMRMKYSWSRGWVRNWERSLVTLFKAIIWS